MAITYYKVPIHRIIDETPDAYTLCFQKPDEEVFAYLPGQYLTLKLNVRGEDLRRAFSFSSSPLADNLMTVTIKRVEGGRASNYIRDEMKVGDEIELLPPMGKFTAQPDSSHRNHYVLIGGGSGITPLMSIAKTMLQAEPSSRVTLWYGNYNEESIIFRQKLEEMVAQNPNRFAVRHTLSNPSGSWSDAVGLLDEQRVSAWLSDLLMEGDERHKLYYMCGPQPMMDGAQKALSTQGINPNDVFREYYSAPLPTEEELAARQEAAAEGVISDGENEYELKTRVVKLTLDGETHEIEVSPDDTILDVAIEAGIDPPYACQSGICTTCRGMLHCGVVSMDEMEGLSEDELEEGFVLVCQSHPLTDDVEVEFM